MSARTLEAIDRILDRSEDADEVLRGTLEVLVDEPRIGWAGIALVEDGALVLGPEAGTPDASRRSVVPIAYQGDAVGELWVDGEAERTFLERVALMISAHVLLGWDTGGEAWEP